MKKILLIDNYDSFTYNLKQLLGCEFAGEIIVRRNDEISLAQIAAADFAAIVISPGPKTPAAVPFSCQVIQTFYRQKPILGICLGMQCINEVFGGSTVRAKYPMHGKTGEIFHQEQGFFLNVKQACQVARYHSLQCIEPGPELEVTARLADQTIMGLQHRDYPVWGVQFHPESFLTEEGKQMINNFLDLLR
ncbi:MAG: aminodeoxychorismate/anthranilate synthase component II [Candidatus Cloacimonadales bacterium]